MTIGSGVFEGAGVEFPTYPLTCVVVLKILWRYRASVWLIENKIITIFSQTNAFSVTGETRKAIVQSHEDEVVDCSTDVDQHCEGSITQSCVGSWNVAGSNIRRSKSPAASGCDELTVVDKWCRNCQHLFSRIASNLCAFCSCAD